MILTAWALCSCGTARPGAPACVYPLREYAGRGYRGGAIYHYYGWSRASGYYASIDSALADRPDIVERMHRAGGEHVAGGWLLLSGLGGMVVSGAGAALSSTDQQPSQPAYAIAVGSVGLSAIAASVGLGLYLGGGQRWSRALAEFNRDAAANGCHAAPLP